MKSPLTLFILIVTLSISYAQSPDSKTVVKTPANTLQKINEPDTFLFYLPNQVLKQGEMPKMGTFSKQEMFVLLNSRKTSDIIQGLTVLAAAREMPPLERVMPYLQKHIKSTSVAVRESALNVAGEYLDSLDILPVFKDVLAGKRPDDKEAALQSLFNMDWCDEVEMLVASALWDEDENVREIALSVINNSINRDSYDEVEIAQKAYQKAKPAHLMTPIQRNNTDSQKNKEIIHEN